MSMFQIFTFSVFHAPSDYSALRAPTLTQASEDLCLKEGRTYAEDTGKGLGETKSSIPRHRKQRINSGTRWVKTDKNHVGGQKKHELMKSLTLNFL